VKTCHSATLFSTNFETGTEIKIHGPCRLLLLLLSLLLLLLLQQKGIKMKDPLAE
jgi:hypothetical protein